MPRPYTVYILECANGALYTGITTDLRRRFGEHKAGTGGRYTRANPPVRIVYSEPHKNRSAASKREAEIKGWSRVEKSRFLRQRKQAFSEDHFPAINSC